MYSRSLAMGHAIGKAMYMRIRTGMAMLAPMRRPYREQTDWGMISAKLEGSALDIIIASEEHVREIERLTPPRGPYSQRLRQYLRR
jgi:hypothetical protein